MIATGNSRGLAKTKTSLGLNPRNSFKRGRGFHSKKVQGGQLLAKRGCVDVALGNSSSLVTSAVTLSDRSALQ